MTEQVLWAFMLTGLAGISTGIGSVIAFFSKQTNTSFLPLGLGFSAGIMIFVSFIELYPEALIALSDSFGEIYGKWLTFMAFLGGMSIMAFIDACVPDIENPHEIQHDEQDLKALKNQPHTSRQLMRLGLITAGALFIHNFPEGLATFIAALQRPGIAFSVAGAIAIHNIPEGIAVSIPVYYATGSRIKAFWYSFLSGISEPLGALIGWFILKPYLSDMLFCLLFSAISGIMVYIALDELIPMAYAFKRSHLAMYGLLGGVALGGVSLLLF